MSDYGIKLVWAHWHDESIIGFSDRARKRWQNDIGPGTKMLIYETSTRRPGYTGQGEMAIVGEVEVTGTWRQGEGKATPTEEHDHPLDVRVLQHRSNVTSISLHQVRKIIGDEKFPHQGQAWKPLSAAQYRMLLAEWK